MAEVSRNDFSRRTLSNHREKYLTDLIKLALVAGVLNGLIIITGGISSYPFILLVNLVIGVVVLFRLFRHIDNLIIARIVQAQQKTEDSDLDSPGHSTNLSSIKPESDSMSNIPDYIEGFVVMEITLAESVEGLAKHLDDIDVFNKVIVEERTVTIQCPKEMKMDALKTIRDQGEIIDFETEPVREY